MKPLIIFNHVASCSPSQIDEICGRLQQFYPECNVISAPGEGPYNSAELICMEPAVDSVPDLIIADPVPRKPRQPRKNGKKKVAKAKRKYVRKAVQEPIN